MRSRSTSTDPVTDIPAGLEAFEVRFALIVMGKLTNIVSLRSIGPVADRACSIFANRGVSLEWNGICVQEADFPRADLSNLQLTHRK